MADIVFRGKIFSRHKCLTETELIIVVSEANLKFFLVSWLKKVIKLSVLRISIEEDKPKEVII